MVRCVAVCAGSILLLAWGRTRATPSAGECPASAEPRGALPPRGDALLQRRSEVQESFDKFTSASDSSLSAVAAAVAAVDKGMGASLLQSSSAALVRQRAKEKATVEEAAPPDFPRRSPLDAGAAVDDFGPPAGGRDPPAGLRERGAEPSSARVGELLASVGKKHRRRHAKGGNSSAPGNESGPIPHEIFNLTNFSNWTNLSNYSYIGEVDLLLAASVNQTGLVTTYSDPGTDNFLYIDLAPLLNNSNLSSEAQIMVTAMATHGTFMDDKGTQVTLHQPLENTQNTMLGFRLTADNYSLDVLQPQLSLRTSDKESEEAFKLGVYSPWRYNVKCLDDDGCMGPGGRILIDGFDLISQGFFMTALNKVHKSRLVSVKVFSMNVDITVEYMEKGLKTVTYSLVALPKEPMKPRAADSRLGYFDVTFTDMGVHQPLLQETLDEAVDRQVAYIWRYPLGKLPDNQIKMYVDPSVPQRWRAYFKEGIEAWNAAFADIGHPAAVRAVMPNDEDWPEDYDPGDVRFSTVAWCPDVNGVYSMGSAKVDPRSGEIIKGDVIFTDGWVHAYMDSLKKLTKTEDLVNGFRHEGLHPEDTDAEHHAEGTEGVGFVARSAGAIGKGRGHVLHAALRGVSGPRTLSLLGLREALNVSRAPSSSVQVEGEPLMEVVAAGLRSVVMHEVGHLLGLRHNFKGSMGVPYECTQDRTCTSIHSTTASVMDYVPMNIPQGGATDVDVFASVVGAYDKLAIRYGYMDVPPNETEDSSSTQGKLLLVLEEAEGFQSCLDEGVAHDDPSCAADDMSSRPVDWYADRLVLIQKSLARILSVAVKPGKPFTNYGEDVLDLLSMAEHIGLGLIDWIGGVNVSMVHRNLDGGSPSAARHPIPATLQLQALSVVFKVMRPYSSGLLPAADEQQFLVIRNKEDVKQLDLKDIVTKMQMFLLQGLLQPSKVRGMFLREELPHPNHTEEGLSTTSFLDVVVAEILGSPSLSLVTRDPQEWGLHKLICKHLRLLHATEELPAELAAHVSRRLAEVRAGAGVRLRALEEELSAARGNSTADPDALALLRHHLLLLRQELKPSFSDDSAYNEETDAMLVKSAATPCTLSILAIVAAAIGGIF